MVTWVLLVSKREKSKIRSSLHFRVPSIESDLLSQQSAKELVKKYPKENHSQMSLRRFRPSAPRTPVQYDANGRALCRYCSTPVPKWRKTYCSDSCVYEWRLRSSKQFARDEVLKRDKGICTRCGLDCVVYRNSLIKKPADIFNVPSQWEAHHKLAVSEGGGESGLGNYETLCLVCHKRETAELRARQAAKRQMEQTRKVLNYLFEDGGWGCTVSEIMTATQLSKTRVRLCLRQLRELHLVEQTGRGGPFAISPTGLSALQTARRRSYCARQL